MAAQDSPTGMPAMAYTAHPLLRCQSLGQLHLANTSYTQQGVPTNLCITNRSFRRHGWDSCAGRTTPSHECVWCRRCTSRGCTRWLTCTRTSTRAGSTRAAGRAFHSERRTLKLLPTKGCTPVLCGFWSTSLRANRCHCHTRKQSKWKRVHRPSTGCVLSLGSPAVCEC